MFSGTSLPIFTEKGAVIVGATMVVGIVIVFGLGAVVGSHVQQNKYENFLDTTEEVMTVMIASDADDVELARELGSAKREILTLSAVVGELQIAKDAMERRAMQQTEIIEVLQELSDLKSIKIGRLEEAAGGTN